MLSQDEKKALFTHAMKELEAQLFQNELLRVVNRETKELVKTGNELVKGIQALRDKYPEFGEDNNEGDNN